MAERKKYLYNFCIILIAFLGVFIRINVLRHNFSFWHDECALAYNIKFKTFLGLFAPLDFNQMAPPFFTVATKFMTKIFGFGEYVFRLIPFLFGCAALPAFYALSKKVLDKNFSVIVAFAFFALNTNLIKYSCEFKPYILDVFFTIICLLFFLNLNFKAISRKKALIYGTLLAFVPWFSLPSVFVILAGVIILLFKDMAQAKSTTLNTGGLVNPPYYYKNPSQTLLAPSFQLTKKLLIIAPITLSLLIYLKIFILNNYSHSNYLLSFWDIAFLNNGPKSIIYVLLITLDYLFQPVNYIFFVAIFIIFSFVVMFKQRREFAKISLLTLVLMLTASHFKIYPFASRLTLFIFPMLLLTLLKPLDFIDFKSIQVKPDVVGLESPTYFANPLYFKDLSRALISALLIFLYFIAFSRYPARIASFFSANAFDRKEYPREMTAFIMKKIKPSDIIYVNNSSDADFAYYSSFYKFKNKIIQERIPENMTKEEYFKKLNSLPKGNYWIFAPIDFINIEVYPWLEEWASGKKILNSIKNDKKEHSLILYIEK